MTVMTTMAMALMVTWSCAVASDHDTSQTDADNKRSLSSYYQAPQLSPDSAVRHFIPGSDHFQVKSVRAVSGIARHFGCGLSLVDLILLSRI